MCVACTGACKFIWKKNKMIYQRYLITIKIDVLLNRIKLYHLLVWRVHSLYHSHLAFMFFDWFEKNENENWRRLSQRAVFNQLT